MKKILVTFLALIMCFGTVSSVFAAGKEFEDVKPTDWFYNDVQTAVGLGLVNGKGETTYAPNDMLTYAEAVKLAACMHQLYTQGAINIPAGNPWYMPYADYCTANGIISKAYNYAENATRAGYMEIFANALPGDGLVAINSVADNSIPDVPSSMEYAPGVYKLYRAGILQGVDAAHNCNPLGNIKRSEVAAILTRMMDKTKRVSFSLGEEEKVEQLAFTKHPIGGAINVGGTIITNVSVQGGQEPYTYQWMYNDGSGWQAVTSALGIVSGETSTKISIKSEAEASYKVRCMAKDALGNEAISDETEFVFKAEQQIQPLKVSKQPENATVELGNAITASVEVTGGTAPYTYLWAMDADGTWYALTNAPSASGADTATLSITTTAANTMRVCCFVTDATGKKVTSQSAELVVTEPAAEEPEPEAEPETPAEPLKITKQPENVNIDLNETAVFEIEVTGGVPEYTYQWFYENCDGFQLLEDAADVAGAKAAKLTITKKGAYTVNLVCQVTDAKGNKIASKKVELFVGPKYYPLEIEAQPVDTTVAVGEDAVLTVKAKNGVGTLTYQWQMNIGPSWVRISDNEMISGTTTDTLTLKSSAASYIEVRCLITDQSGNSVASNGVKATFQ